MGLFAESALQTYLNEGRLKERRSSGVSTVMASIQQRILEGLRDEIGEFIEDLERVNAVRVTKGNPPMVILDEAQQLGVVLLVLGSHSHVTDMAVALGRSASRLVQLSEMPQYLLPVLQHRGRGDL
jgi:nucleotide-binding universal stress UspA family protein